jgi:hypothetical protein
LLFLIYVTNPAGADGTLREDAPVPAGEAFVRNELGHADWLEVDSPASMAKALLKALHEWKDIRGFPWEEIRENVLGIGKTASVAKKIESMYPVLDGHITKATSYSDAIRKLQAERYPRIIGRTGPLGSPATVLAPAESEVPVVA